MDDNDSAAWMALIMKKFAVLIVWGTPKTTCEAGSPRLNGELSCISSSLVCQLLLEVVQRVTYINDELCNVLTMVCMIFREFSGTSYQTSRASIAELLTPFDGMDSTYA